MHIEPALLASAVGVWLDKMVADLQIDTLIACTHLIITDVVIYPVKLIEMFLKKNTNLC